MTTDFSQGVRTGRGPGRPEIGKLHCFRCPDDLWETVEKAAEKDERTVSEWIRRAIATTLLTQNMEEIRLARRAKRKAELREAIATTEGELGYLQEQLQELEEEEHSERNFPDD